MSDIRFVSCVNQTIFQQNRNIPRDVQQKIAYYIAIKIQTRLFSSAGNMLIKLINSCCDMAMTFQNTRMSMA